MQSHIRKDSITRILVEDLFKADISPPLRNMLHLSLNSLVLTNEILASSMSQNDKLNFEVPQAKDVLQSELSTVFSRVDGNSRTLMREDYERRLTFIKSMVNPSFGTNFERDYLASKGNKERLLDKFNLDKIIVR